MGTESTNADAFSDSMKRKITECMTEDDFADTGVQDANDLDDRELFRLAMMHGLLDEDAGQDR